MPERQDSPDVAGAVPVRGAAPVTQDSGRGGAELAPVPAGPEVWKPIPGHKGYEASSHGRVRSAPRTLSDGRVAGGMVLTPIPDKDCYMRVKLRGRWVPVHLSVLLAFHGRPEGRHLNGDQLDNTPGNLAWGSHRDNERDKKRKAEVDGTRPFPVEPFLGRGQQR